MKLPRAAVMGLSTAAFALCACSSSDTVVALNVSAGSDVGFVSKMHVTINQPNQAPNESDYTPPAKQVQIASDAGVDAGTMPVLDAPFYDRITLPASWPSGSAHVTVTTFDMAGMPYRTPAPVAFDVHSGNTVAVFVSLDLPDGGADAATEGGVDGSTANDSGTVDAGGTSGGDTGSAAETGSGADAGGRDGATDAASGG